MARRVAVADNGMRCKLAIAVVDARIPTQNAHAQEDSLIRALLTCT